MKSNILREKRNIKVAELFCDEIFSSITDDEWENFIIINKVDKDNFNKEFNEEYFPLSLYASSKYPNRNIFISLCDKGSKIGAKITDYDNQCIETIQITTASINRNISLQNKKLLRDGISLRVGIFEENKDSSISQRRGLRTEKSAFFEEYNEIKGSIEKKLRTVLI